MVLIDADKNRAEGEALDISHGLPFARPMKIAAGDYDDIVDAAIIVVTAGAGQKPGETRLDLVKKNVAIFKSIIPEIAKRNCKGILLIVANPVDILTQVAVKLSGFPENRVFGSGTTLDYSYRHRNSIIGCFFLFNDLICTVFHSLCDLFHMFVMFCVSSHLTKFRNWNSRYIGT